MAHKTLVGGTAYEISGGKTLIDGTAYSIDKGKTLVGGTAYEVGFSQPAHDVLVTGGVLGIAMTQNTVELDGNTYAVASASPAFYTITKSTSKMKVTIINGLGTPTVTLNGETIHTGLGECVIDLSDVTHVSIRPVGISLAITTYNILAPEDVTVTVKGTGGGGAYIEHNGITYTSAATFTAKTGDLIYVSALSQTAKTTYYHVVTSDTNVQLNASSNTYGTVTITTS